MKLPLFPRSRSARLSHPVVLAAGLLSLTLAPCLWADTYSFDSDTLEVNGGGNKVEGQNYSTRTEPDGAVLFRLNASVAFQADDRLIFTGSKPVRFRVLGDLVIPEGMTVSAAPGGAGGGKGGSGANTRGLGGDRGLPQGIDESTYTSRGGNGGLGGSPGFTTTGNDGGNGYTGKAGRDGGAGTPGGIGQPGAAGFGNPGSGGVNPGPAGNPGRGGSGGEFTVNSGTGGNGDGRNGVSVAETGKNGQAGRPGSRGNDGGTGAPGGGGLQFSPVALAAGGGGSSGGGGAGAGGGGAGAAGGGGGGGGGGEGSFFYGGSQGGPGGYGGSGGFGGKGNPGADGAAGGAGGGAFEIGATGSVTIGGILSATGGVGGDGFPPLPVVDSRPSAPGTGDAQRSHPPQNGYPGSTGDADPGAKGGDGGTGGVGGSGGLGGIAGNGGGGAGGTIHIRGKSVNLLPSAQVLVSGGNGGGSGAAAGAKGQDGRYRVLPVDAYRENFDRIEWDVFETTLYKTELRDGSVIRSDTGAEGLAYRSENADDHVLQLTQDGTLWTRAAFELPELNSAAQGFTATFQYRMAASSTAADGFGFYLKPYSAPVDTAARNPVGGYASGLGVEFNTFSSKKHDIRVNGTVLPLPGTVPAPLVDGNWHSVSIVYDKSASGSPGKLTLSVDGVKIVDALSVNYAPADSDRFVFTARTGGFAETVQLDNIVVIPAVPTVPAATPLQLTLQHTGWDAQGNHLVRLTWNPEPGGHYKFQYSYDLVSPWTDYIEFDYPTAVLDDYDPNGRVFYRLLKTN
ncbi:MAG: hypothetical protein V4726_13180 [Verrucomicrobiota bacterium]